MAPQSGEDEQTRRGPRSRGHLETVERERRGRAQATRRCGKKAGQEEGCSQEKSTAQQRLPDLSEFLVNQRRISLYVIRQCRTHTPHAEQNILRRSSGRGQNGTELMVTT